MLLSPLVGSILDTFSYLKPVQCVNQRMVTSVVSAGAIQESVAADVRRLCSIGFLQNEPPYVGCYKLRFFLNPPWWCRSEAEATGLTEARSSNQTRGDSFATSRPLLRTAKRCSLCLFIIQAFSIEVFDRQPRRQAYSTSRLQRRLIGSLIRCSTR